MLYEVRTEVLHAIFFSFLLIRLSIQTLKTITFDRFQQSHYISFMKYTTGYRIIY